MEMTLVLTILAVINIPLLGLVYRAGAKASSIEVRLTQVLEDMREDRKATNDRLTYLEHEVWKK